MAAIKRKTKTRTARRRTPGPRKTTARKSTTRKTRARKPGAKRAAGKSHAMQRADFGRPVASYYAKQAPAFRPILASLRDLIEAAAPDATASLKWGVPFYSIRGRSVAGLSAHKAHINLILYGPPGTFDDPDGRLVQGKPGAHLRITKPEDVPRRDVARWIASSVRLARGA